MTTPRAEWSDLENKGYMVIPGFLSPDDIEVMERNQVGLQAMGNEWLFIGRGIHREEKLADGATIGHDMDENQLRGLWRHYAQLMSHV